MSSHNYQQKILMFQKCISISIQISFVQMRLEFVLCCITFFDARNGSKTAINEEVRTLKTLSRLFLQHH